MTRSWLAALWLALAPLAAVAQDFVFVEAEAIPPPPPSASEFASLFGLLVSPDNRFVYALYDVAIGDDRVLIYARASDGSIALVDSPQTVANPTAMAMTPDGSALFVIGNNGDVHALGRDATTGSLTYLDSVYDGLEGADLLQYAQAVAVSPAGDSVYVASNENAITSFSWDGSSLALVDEDYNSQLDVTLAFPTAILVTPDGRFVLVTSAGDDGLLVFERNIFLGELYPVDRFVNGEEGVDGLDFPLAIAAAPTTIEPGFSSSIYVLGAQPKIGIFEAVPVNQELTVRFVEAVGGGNAPKKIVVSPNGARVYLSDGSLNRVAALWRDPATGELGPLEAAIAQGDPGVSGLTSPTQLAVSPNGRSVYAASNTDDTIVVLSVPEADGAVAAIAGLAALAIRRPRCTGP